MFKRFLSSLLLLAMIVAVVMGSSLISETNSTSDVSI